MSETKAQDQRHEQQVQDLTEKNNKLASLNEEYATKTLGMTVKQTQLEEEIQSLNEKLQQKQQAPQKSSAERATEEFNALIAKRLGSFKSQASLISENLNREVALAEEVDKLKTENSRLSKIAQESDILKQQNLVLQKHLQEGYKAN